MKKLLSIFVVAFAISFSPNAYSSSCKSTSDGFVESIKTDVIGIIESSASASEKESQLTSIFKKSVNINWMSKFVMGRNWRALKDEQKSQYQEAYENYLISTYVPKFRNYKGQEIQIVDTKKLNENDFLVTSKVVETGEPTVNIKYRLKKDSECFKIHDIVAEGVSLITTQRQDFDSVYRNKGFDKLVMLLNKK